MARKPAKPKIGKPMATKKLTKNPKPAGPSRTAKTVVTGQRCERIDDKRPCGRAAVNFRQGQHVCAGHTPKGDPNCTHSLSGTFGCAYCGAPPERGPHEQEATARTVPH